MNNKLDKHLVRLLIGQNIFLIGRFLSELFFSLYIWKQTESLALVGLYGSLFMLCHGLSYVLAGRFAKKGFVHELRIAALIGSVITFWVVFLLRASAINYIIPIAIFLGTFNGMYRIAYQTLKFDLTTKANRGNFSGTHKALNTIGNIFTPLLGGWLIHINAFGNGYMAIFLIASFAYALSAVVGFVPITHKKRGPFVLKATWREITSRTPIKRLLIANFLSDGGNNGAIKIILPIFILTILGSELELGGALSMFSFVAAFSSIYIGRYVPYAYYHTIFIISGFLLGFGTLSLVIFPTLLTYLIYGIIKETAQTANGITKEVFTDNIIHEIPNHEDHRIEYFCLRELLTITGARLPGYIALMLIPAGENQYIFYVVILISIMLFLVPFPLLRMKKYLAK